MNAAIMQYERTAGTYHEPRQRARAQQHHGQGTRCPARDQLELTAKYPIPYGGAAGSRPEVMVTMGECMGT
jgi:hypothetical protein